VVLLFSVCLSYRNDDIVEKVNKMNVGWVAGENRFLENMNHHNVKKLLGWNKENERKLPDRKTKPLINLSSIPTSFAAAKNWPQCKTIGTIYNQARCGSCWAFGGVESFQDRMCIATNGKFNQALSFGQMTECNEEASGCEGGSNYALWTYLQDTGVVTNACYPYNIPTCPPANQPCLNFVPTPACWTNNTCVNGANWQLYQVSDTYNLNSVSDMQTDIMTKGPVEACFSVYEDFLSYKSGVYQYTTGSYLGGHCVKIQGWGVEGGLPYWLVNNQWTTYWGDNGQFKILRGSDECGIEDDVASGDPQVSNIKRW